MTNQSDPEARIPEPNLRQNRELYLVLGGLRAVLNLESVLRTMHYDPPEDHEINLTARIDHNQQTFVVK